MTSFDTLNVLVAVAVIGFGAGYAVRMWWEWHQARKLRQEIAGLLVKRLQALRRFRVVK